MRLTKEIVHSIRSKYQARFIRWNVGADGWEEISDQVARDKVSHALRFAAKGAKGGASRAKSLTSLVVPSRRRRASQAMLQRKSWAPSSASYSTESTSSSSSLSSQEADDHYYDLSGDEREPAVHAPRPTAAPQYIQQPFPQLPPRPQDMILARQQSLLLAMGIDSNTPIQAAGGPSLFSFDTLSSVDLDLLLNEKIEDSDAWDQAVADLVEV